ncbi:phage shock protein operon transcriptional activator [Parasphingorhabdus halotolerans]|uniref:Phage shock protein operon transcriptional activator n=1 Tax=Parasphingorhabdus halotolerans TaxID=2725558 RepID=A0A6H2DJM5_9SPHN|nr:phage shock protein operon transcriptional activator [Parasphingorhabdus halotolerans]QJB68337.1 phage shock protein operon transcriptional activator [Parasphingorhabdus halotolerans]
MERESQFIGESGAFLDAVEKASRAAGLNRPVLVVGERGTGKELIAERLHRLSARWDGPLITLNCAAMPETLIEAELFGHEAGAFTGATKARAGRFEEADGGTLFLDELGTLSSGAQERLLRAVEYGEITRIGSSRPVRVDVRIVAATNADLPKMADEGSFRADLLDRLSFEVVTLPPLRVREGDVTVLSDYFGRRMAAELDWPEWPGLGKLASEALERHSWPGNVRELRNVIERAVYQWGDYSRPVDHVVFDPFASPWKPQEMPRKKTAEEASNGSIQPPASTTSSVPPSPIPQFDAVDDMKEAVEAFEKRILEEALAKSRYNQRQTAKALNLTYDQLRHSLKRHDLLGQ